MTLQVLFTGLNFYFLLILIKKTILNVKPIHIQNELYTMKKIRLLRKLYKGKMKKEILISSIQ